jgi:hypothetical protein
MMLVINKIVIQLFLALHEVNVSSTEAMIGYQQITTFYFASHAHMTSCILL